METNKIYQGHTLDVLKTFPDESIDCQITSPPYWGLRDYGVEPIIFDGKEGCEHEWEENSIVGNNKRIKSEPIKSNFCHKCHAWKGQLGLEPDFNLFIKHLCDIFDEVKKVLKKDGVCWVNMGDTYGGSNQGYGQKPGQGSGIQNSSDGYFASSKNKPPMSKLMPKCLMLIPERFALEMIKRGWILRNKIIWRKPNHMPSSVKDRFANSWEYLFMFVKNKEKSNDIQEWLSKPLRKEEASWLAAMIDGEGTIGIRRAKHIDKHDVFGPFIIVNNSCKEIIDRCKAITGIGNIRQNGGENFPMFLWEVSHQGSISIIGEVYPYLIQKREQAKVIIALQKTNKYRGNNKGENRGPKPISEKEYQEKISLFELVKKLNQREIKNSGLPEPSLDRFGGCEDYYFDLDNVREPYKYGQTAKFNIRVRDVKLGRIKGHDRKASEDEVNKYQEFNHIKYGEREKYLIERLYDIKKEIRDEKISYHGKSANLPQHNNALANAKAVRTALDILKQEDKITDEELKWLKDYTQNHFGHPKGKNPDDIFEDDFWNITTKPFKEAHFAVFPERLIEKPIKVTRENAVILDIFIGSGTTGVVALKNNRNFIGIELKPEYIEIANRRLKPFLEQKRLE